MRSRPKPLLLLTGVLVGGLTIIAWTQQWFVVTLTGGALGQDTLPVDGSIAAGGLAGLGLAMLALVGALSIAGRVFRVVLGVLQILLGVTVTLSAVIAVNDPVAASTAAITEVTGESGDRAIRQLVESASVGFWALAAVVLGVAGIVLGALILATGRRWPGPTRKYQAARFERADDAALDHPAGTSAAVGDSADADRPGATRPPRGTR